MCMLHSCKPLNATTTVIRTVTPKLVPQKLVPQNNFCKKVAKTSPPRLILAAKSGPPLPKTVPQGGSNLAT